MENNNRKNSNDWSTVKRPCLAETRVSRLGQVYGPKPQGPRMGGFISFRTSQCSPSVLSILARAMIHSHLASAFLLPGGSTSTLARSFMPISNRSQRDLLKIRVRSCHSLQKTLQRAPFSVEPFLSKGLGPLSVSLLSLTVVFSPPQSPQLSPTALHSAP